MMNSIQYLRGVAVIVVVLYHLDISLFGYLGVDMFFFISGFVITLSLVRSFDSGKLSYGEFLKKRFLRLMPAMGITVGLTIVMASYFQNVLGLTVTRDMGIASIFAVGNIQAHLLTSDYFGAEAFANGLLHTWSLSLEWQFYLVFPVALFFLLKRLKRYTTIQVLLALVATISFGLFTFGSLIQDVPFLGAIFGYYSPVTRAWQFLIGSILAFAYLSRFGNRIVSQKKSWIAPVATICLISLFFLPATFSTELLSLLIILGAGLLVFNDREPLPNRWGWRTPLSFIGDRSYSIYLVHWPVIVVINTLDFSKTESVLIVLFMSLFLSFFMHRWFEAPFSGPISKRAKGNKGIHRVAMASVVLLLGLTVGTATIANTDSYLQEVAVTPVPNLLGCADGTQVCVDGISYPSTLSPKAFESARGVILIGDSNAAQYYRGIAKAAASLEMPFISFTKNGCPSFTVFLDNRACAQYVQDVLKYTAEMDPALVVVGFSTNHFTVQKEILRKNPLAVDQIAFNLMLHLEQLEKFGHQVVLVEPIPVVESLSLELISKWNTKPVFRDVKSALAQTEQLKDAVLRHRGESKVQETSFWIRPWAGICDKNSCEIFDGSQLNYRDSYHLSPTFADSLGNYWQIEIARSLTLEKSPR